MKFSIILFLFVISAIASAQEGNLSVPLSLESAAVLPKGIRNIQFLNARIDATSKFGENRQSVPTGDALNKEVTFKKSIEGKKDPYERGKLKGLLQAKGIEEETVIGKVTGEVNAQIDAKVPIFAYGISDRWTVAMAIPVITTDISIDTGFESNENLDKFSKDVLQQGLSSDNKAAKLRHDTMNAVEIKLKENGYKKLSESEGRRTRIGDIKLLSKYLLQDTGKFKGALKNEVNLPTGTPTDPDKAVDIQSGDGQMDVGVGYIAEYQFNDAFAVTAYAGYLVQLASKTTKRIPEEKDSKISSDKEKVNRDLGDQYNSQMGVKWTMVEGLSLTNTLSYQKKERDVYQGSKFANYRYDYLEQETQQEMQSYLATLAYSTIPLFRQKRFPIPLQAGLQYTNIYAGKNVVKDEIITFQLALFF